MSALCPACSATVAAGARYCEGCGATIPDAPEPDVAESHIVDAPGTACAPDAPDWGCAPDWGSPTGGVSTSPTAWQPAPDLGRRLALSEPAPAEEPPGDLDEKTIHVAVRPPRARCAACGGAMAGDGYCTECGAKAANERDHQVQHPADWVAGVCDRGIRHARNEDAMTLAAEPQPGSFAVLVVCDGVSSARDSDVASLAAARAACTVLAAGGPSGNHAVTGEVAERMATWSRLLNVAAQAANDAIVSSSGWPAKRVPRGAADNPPSCTFVAAVVDNPLMVVGWLGDSRAYWLPDVGPAHQLSVDDSWAQELIALGMARAVAEASPQAHAITRWLGADTASTRTQTAATFPRRPGWLLVCSDGLWNYCSPADDVADLVHRTQAETGPDPLSLADALVSWANAQGGHDNVTVALARLDGARTPGFDMVPDGESPEREER